MITTPYERMGGESTVLNLVNRFYDLMDRIPEVQEVRDMHSGDLAEIRERLFYEESRFIIYIHSPS